VRWAIEKKPEAIASLVTRVRIALAQRD